MLGYPLYNKVSTRICYGKRLTSIYEAWNAHSRILLCLLNITMRGGLGRIRSRTQSYLISDRTFKKLSESISMVRGLLSLTHSYFVAYHDANSMIATEGHRNVDLERLIRSNEFHGSNMQRVFDFYFEQLVRKETSTRAE